MAAGAKFQDTSLKQKHPRLLGERMAVQAAPVSTQQLHAALKSVSQHLRFLCSPQTLLLGLNIQVKPGGALWSIWGEKADSTKPVPSPQAASEGARWGQCEATTQENTSTQETYWMFVPLYPDGRAHGVLFKLNFHIISNTIMHPIRFNVFENPKRNTHPTPVSSKSSPLLPSILSPHPSVSLSHTESIFSCVTQNY